MNLSYYQETVTENKEQVLPGQNIETQSLSNQNSSERSGYSISGTERNAPQVLRREVQSSYYSTQESIMLFCADPVSRSAMTRFLESENLKLSDYNSTAFPENIGEEITLFLIDSATFNNMEQVCHRLTEKYPEIPIVCMDEPTADAEKRKRVARLVFASLIKPCDRHSLLQAVRQALKIGRYVRENKLLRQAIGTPVIPSPIVGSSAVLQTLRKQIEAFARLDNTILISGERGTGKTIIAQQIHQAGPRGRMPFLAISCNSLPQDILEADLFGAVQGGIAESPSERPGKMELAHRGTIFLDHIEALSPSLQKKIFQFLQDKMVTRLGTTEGRRIDTRIIASTSSDLAIACVQGRFRDELYFRLNSLTLNAPSIRDRTEDIPALSREILAKIARASHRNLSILSTAALNKLRQYSWPYNIRELESVLQKAVETAPDTVITENDISFDTMIPDNQTSDGAMGLAGLTMAEIERRAIIETINACGGNRAQSARKLGVSEKTIYNKIKQFKLRGIV